MPSTQVQYAQPSSSVLSQRSDPSRDASCPSISLALELLPAAITVLTRKNSHIENFFGCVAICARRSSPSQVVVFKRAGRLGVSAVDAPNRHGAVISGLCENSVAAAAGLHVGDIVVTVNGHMVGGHRDCIEAIDGAADRVAFVLARPTREVFLDKAQGRIGITCTTDYGSGVLVSALEEGSLASRCGLFVGDTLLSVNGVLCESVSQQRAPMSCLRAARLSHAARSVSAQRFRTPPRPSARVFRSDFGEWTPSNGPSRRCRRPPTSPAATAAVHRAPSTPSPSPSPPYPLLRAVCLLRLLPASPCGCSLSRRFSSSTRRLSCASSCTRIHARSS